MQAFFGKPLNWIITALGLVIAAMTAFVVFQPIQVVPRFAYGPEDYTLLDQHGQSVTPDTLAGQIVLLGFGYTSDPSDQLEQTLVGMQDFQATLAAADLEEHVTLALIFFDNQRDTVERRQQFAVQHDLDPARWLLLSGDADTLKRVIGQGFGIYYEAVPLAELLETQPTLTQETSSLAPDDYGYVQANRYILVDERNIIRADYRIPLDVEMAMRDIRLIIREKSSTGARKALNEAAHLFLCYPQ